MRTPHQWRKDRRRADEQRVLDAIGQLRPSKASGFPIMRLAGLGAARTYAALARLESRGQISGQWEPGEAPRRRLYKVEREMAR